MANILDKTIVLDGWKNVTVKLTGVLDTSDISETPAIALTDLSSTNPLRVFVGLRIDRVEYSIGNGIEITLSWNGNIPQIILPLAGRGYQDYALSGGIIPDRTRLGFDGSINLYTTGFNLQAVGKQNFSIQLEMIKLYTK